MEQWLPVPSVAGVSASSLGRIVLPAVIAKMPNGGVRRYETRPTYGTIHKKGSYAYYALYNKRLGNLKVHKLVCEAFHGPAPKDKPFCIHKDENSMNNLPCNLKWGTQKENLNMPGFIAHCKTRTGDNSPRRKGTKR